MADLSFTLVGMYQDDQETVTGLPSLLPGFAEVEMQLAAADPQISFVDLWHDAPGYLAAVNAGYLADSVHPTAAGADAYSRTIMAALVPEPTLIGLAAILLPLIRRRRSI
ncbi:MAG: hypothetical protein JWM57_2451 [Phycisphaerales bacterium]|nr:hypothetical protein [Phycisphaerales bacterium]